MDETEVIVLNKAREVLVGFTKGIIYDYHAGICGNMERVLGESLYEIWDSFYASVMYRWYYYSGNPLYPIPLPDWCSSDVFNRSGWYSVLSKWDKGTSYGMNRFMFVNYLIEQIDLELEKLS